MKASEVQDITPIKPLVEGNTMFITGIEYVEGDKGNNYKVSWTEKETNRVFESQNLDPFNTPDTLNKKLVAAGYNRLFRIARAYMSTEAYANFAQLDLLDLKTAIATIKKMVDPSWLNVETKLIFGYRTYDGFMSLPTYTEFISTPFAPQDLEYPEGELSPKYVANPTKPRPAKGQPTADKETSAPKGNVNDDV